MITFPNGKINLGLFVTGKRNDGYHDLISCFYPIAWCDALEIIESKSFKLSISGTDIPGDANNNLCKKAYDLLSGKFDIPPVHIHLHKVIPIGSGLGGGSSNGAFTLNMLNEFFQLGLTNNNLESYAAKLGSDCPFFVKSQPAIATGTGTKLEALELNLSNYYVALIHPNIHISTADGYESVTYSQPGFDLKETLSQRPPSEWRDLLKNNFESSVFKNHPEIERVKMKLYNEGAIYASMTGSGSIVYGIFESEPDITAITGSNSVFVSKM
ncbi:MAG: 4-(cytidine 5'-diphospho)-2-C-methyl-D-erythritol kinase [Bacteroidetes bacterium]|nr:4-(cytidine 5'-diphospho)-2-C-methyl-D-erythritol kinase [Bacteroidota bacterium]MDA1119282.1 4-(cytidine 5'-diphospho)-2-C-methyl-D-erythritol kinase [Bacteroidota bacterium]